MLDKISTDELLKEILKRGGKVKINRNVQINIRLTKEEKTILERAADIKSEQESHYVSISDFVRTASIKEARKVIAL